MVAVCKACGNDMNASSGCSVGKIVVKGTRYDRIKVCAPGDLYGAKPKGFRCHDCNAAVGQFHHWGCDAERCPTCGFQLLSCGCEDIYVEGERKST